MCLGSLKASSRELQTASAHDGETGVHSASSRSGVRNGLANLHNASRAQVPIVNLVGQHRYFTPAI